MADKEAREAAAVLKAAVEETGIDWMKSPLSDLVRTLELAADMESGFRPIRPCGKD